MLSSWTWGVEYTTNNNIFNGASSYCLSQQQRTTASQRKQARLTLSRQGVQAKQAFVNAQKIIKDYGITPHYYERPGIENDSCIAWSSVPLCCQAVGGCVPQSRVDRKAVQIENMVYVALCATNHLLAQSKTYHGDDSKVRIVEFCAGSGFVALPLAWMLREHAHRLDIVLVDWKGPSLDIAHARIKALNNTPGGGVLDGVVRVVEQDIATYNEPFQLGLSLHACGPATDVSLTKCVEARAFFVHAPCCLGKICKVRVRPLSKAFWRGLGGLEEEKEKEKEKIIILTSSRLFTSLVRAGDFGHGCEASRRGEKDEEARRLAKSLVEEDRRCWAVENGFTLSGLMKMHKGASPKGDILYGAPDEAGDNGFEWPKKWHVA